MPALSSNTEHPLF